MLQREREGRKAGLEEVHLKGKIALEGGLAIASQAGKDLFMLSVSPALQPALDFHAPRGMGAVSSSLFV